MRSTSSRGTSSSRYFSPSQNTLPTTRSIRVVLWRRCRKEWSLRPQIFSLNRKGRLWRSFYRCWQCGCRDRICHCKVDPSCQSILERKRLNSYAGTAFIAAFIAQMCRISQTVRAHRNDVVQSILTFINGYFSILLPSLFLFFVIFSSVSVSVLFNDYPFQKFNRRTPTSRMVF